MTKKEPIWPEMFRGSIHNPNETSSVMWECSVFEKRDPEDWVVTVYGKTRAEVVARAKAIVALGGK